MANILQILRTYTFGKRPQVGTQSDGAPYVNFADKQFGVVDSTQSPQDLIGVPFWSQQASYNTGQPVNYFGLQYIALVNVAAGPFNPAQWSQVASQNWVTNKIGNTALFGYLSGLVLSNDTTTPNTALDITPGVATSDDGQVFMQFTSPFIKTTAAWAAGSSKGALDTGAIAPSAWYHVFAIQNPPTQVNDFLFSRSLTPTVPSGFIEKRRIGSFLTNASAAIVPFLQLDDTFYWKTGYGDYNAPITTTPKSIPLTVPPGVRVRPLLNAAAYNPSGSTCRIRVYSPELPDIQPSNVTSATVGILVYSSPSVGSWTSITSEYTDTNSQIRVWETGLGNDTGTTTLASVTNGWIDTRGK